MGILSKEKIQLCDIQGRLFELSLKKSYDSPAFVQDFMNSKVAASLDDSYDRLQWAGEEYILDELEEETGGLTPAGTLFQNEVLYWMGYVYRYWHFFNGCSSKEIYEIADATLMNDSWLGFHTLDVEMAIEDLIEIKRQRQSLNQKY